MTEDQELYARVYRLEKINYALCMNCETKDQKTGLIYKELFALVPTVPIKFAIADRIVLCKKCLDSLKVFKKCKIK